MPRSGSKFPKFIFDPYFLRLLLALVAVCIVLPKMMLIPDTDALARSLTIFTIYGGIAAFMIFTAWQFLMGPTSRPTANKQARLLTYNFGSLQLPAAIVDDWTLSTSGNSWKAVEESSPVKFVGKFKTRTTADSTVIDVDVTYGVRSRGKLCAAVTELPNNQINLEILWEGADSALSDTTSDDYRLVNYLIRVIEGEFLSRGCRVPAPSAATSAISAKPLSFAAARSGARPRNRNVNKAQGWSRLCDGAPPSVQCESWPSPQDFSEAIQNPHLSMADTELKISAAELNSLGLPQVASGAFASVFKLSCGNEHWAVRCFNSKPTDQHDRYQAISRFVLADDLTYTVDFNYQSSGIKHQGNWFPILKMNWVDGLPLDAYVRNCLHDRERLIGLRDDFSIMMDALRRNGIAHGDLQHGNILVDDNGLYLADYDGMYVPELEGRQSNELGHRNFQHPGRTAEHYGPYLDNFSAWLIDSSLVCLIEDPSLWESFSGGDECLLFRQADLLAPEKSSLFRTLGSHPSERIRESAAMLKMLFAMEVELIPYLPEPLQDNQLSVEGALQEEPDMV